MISLLKKVFGDTNSHAISSLQGRVDAINALEESMQALSDTELRDKTREFKERLASGATLDDLLPEAFAVVREASRRTLGQRHFDVQLMGGMVIHEGKIAEMRTGEGKTLVATLPVYLNALTGEGVHLVTVNDYLARRDAVWMGQIYAFLGLSVGIINSQENSFLYDPTFAPEEAPADEERDKEGFYKVHQEFLRPVSKREAYAADITYGTNNEFGFDYLRDNISYSKDALRQRPHAFAIVDEVDSVLIDEARTPLIISAPTAESEDLYATFARIADHLTEGEDADYEVDEKDRAVRLTDRGIEKAEKELGIDNIYTDAGVKYVHHLETAVRAKALFRREKEYVVKDGEVIIVDEYTGRLMPGRRYSAGIHQAIEAKEGVTVNREARTFATITFQNYFRLYKKLAGMTGTAKTSEEEFYKVYGLEVVVIPTNLEIQRVDHNDLIFQSEIGKFKAVAKKVKELHEKGQPVLIGTASIQKNEELSEYLQAVGIHHEVLNAKNHEREGEIIAQAGHKGAVTIATNMAGRGVDIKLGGKDASEAEYDEILKLGGLFVLGTERHDARRIDNQLRGRSGRQGDPGETQFFVSLEDDLVRIFAPDVLKNLMGRLGLAEDEAIFNPMVTRALESAQTKIEGFNFDQRKNTLSYDDVLNHQRKAIYNRRGQILHATDEEVVEALRVLVGEDETMVRTIDEKMQTFGIEAFARAVRLLMLQTIDMFWVDHLETMDYLRKSVSLRGYGQRDPLVEYRREGLNLFRGLEASIDAHIVSLIPNIGAQIPAVEERELQATKEGAEAAVSESSGTHVRTTQKIGRNDVVSITNGSETREMKYKKAIPLIESGAWRVLEK